MPSIAYPIGATVLDKTFGNCIIIGYKHLGLQSYHLYATEHDICFFSNTTRLVFVHGTTLDKIAFAQSIALRLPNWDASISGKFTTGCNFISKKLFPDSFEYIILDNGQRRPDGQIYYLIAYHKVDTDNWFIDYHAENAPVLANANMNTPTHESTSNARKLLFTHVIAHPFTDF